MYKGILLSGFFFLLCIQVFSQDAITQLQNGSDPNVLYRNEADGGIVIHSQGFGLNYRRGTHVNGASRKFLEFELVSMKHPKETKTYNSTFPNSKGFYYGKLNSVMVLRSGVGYQKVMFGKAERERKSVEIRYSVYVGPSLSLAKPVYLEIIRDRVFPSQFELSTERYDPSQHSLANIYSKAPYLKGFDEMKIYPGGYAKFVLGIEYADKHNEIKAVETGIVLDAYFKPVPIMATEKNNPFFFTVFINLIMGKRWF